MSEERTLYQWRLELPKNLRNRYVRNIMNDEDSVLNRTEPSLDEAIIMGFSWDDTPEGIPFWDNIHDLASEGNLTPKSKIKVPNL